MSNMKKLSELAVRGISALRMMLMGKEGIYYINGPESLPPPLKTEEETAVLEKLQQDDDTAKEILITHNLRLVVYIAKKFEAPGLNVEDLISIGTIGLIKAVNTFRPEKGIKLATYASRCIENEILMFLRKSSQLKNEVSIDEPLNVDYDGNELLIADILGSENDLVNIRLEKESEENQLMRAVMKLSQRELSIMELRFGLNGKKPHTQKEVADMLGISQSYISRLEKKIIRRLRNEISESGKTA